MSEGVWFLSSEIPNGEAEHSAFHVIPSGAEFSVSYEGGTTKGPEAILRASDQLEVTSCEREPAARGIHTQSPIPTSLTHEEYLAELKRRTDLALFSSAVPVILGGEHSISFAPIEACCQRYGKIGIIHIDAHADLRRAYEGDIYSHASVMQRVTEELSLPVFGIGMRALGKEEIDFRKDHGLVSCDALTLSKLIMDEGSEFPEAVLRLIPQDMPRRVYISFDVDGLDPSCMPATGTPVPGGLRYFEALLILKAIAREFQIIGFDLVELSPREGFTFCDFTAAQLVYDMMALTLISHGE